MTPESPEPLGDISALEMMIILVQMDSVLKILIRAIDFDVNPPNFNAIPDFSQMVSRKKSSDIEKSPERALSDEINGF